MLGSISKWFWIFLIPAGADERLKACPARWSATNAAGQGGKMLIALSAISVTYLDIPRLWMTMDDYGVTRAHPSMLPALDDWISMNFPFVQHRGATTERMLTFKIPMQWYDLIYIFDIYCIQLEDVFEAFPSIRSQEKRELAQISWPAALAAWVASLGPWHAFWIWASYPAASTHDTSLCADVPWPQKRCIGWWWVVSRTTKSVDFAPPCAWKQEVPLRLVLTHCDVGQLRRCFPFFGAHRWSAKVIAPAKVARLVTKRLHIIQSARIAGHCNQKQGISSSVRFHTVLPYSAIIFRII